MASKKQLILWGTFLLLLELAVIFYIKGNKMSFKNQIINYTDKHCTNSNACLINLNDIITFKWDKAYIFSKGEKPSTIQKIIGIPYTLYKDIGFKIILIRDEEIIYYEEIFFEAEYGQGKKYVMPTFNKLEAELSKEMFFGYYYLEPNNAALEVSKYINTGEKGETRYSIYYLSPTNNQQTRPR